MTHEIYAIAAVALALYSAYVLWVLYLAVMNLLRVQQAGKLSKTIYYLSWPLLAIALIVDVAFNVIVGSVIFLQPPDFKRLTLSARMDDLIRNGSGWRKRNAIIFVAYLLEPFDTSGMHTTYGQKHD